ncbi:MAG: hypothetical protein M3N46_06380 [Actinomycetota bacterium]|nr:hypothetical protein [Actinomycetota bacterium]
MTEGTNGCDEKENGCDEKKEEWIAWSPQAARQSVQTTRRHTVQPLM